MWTRRYTRSLQGRMKRRRLTRLATKSSPARARRLSRLRSRPRRSVTTIVRAKRRVQTRPPSRIQTPNRFKTYKTQHYVSLYSLPGTSPTARFSANSSGSSSRQNFCFFLSPATALTADNNRQVLGDMGKLVAVNIEGTFYTKVVSTHHIRISVVEDISNPGEWLSNTTTGVAENMKNKCLQRHFKNVSQVSPPGATVPFTTSTILSFRWALPRNITATKVLAEKIISLDDINRSYKGFHFYVPANKSLDKDKTVNCREEWTNISVANVASIGATQDTVRMSQQNPLFLLVEYLPGQDLVSETADEELIRGNIRIKYTMRDGI